MNKLNLEPQEDNKQTKNGISRSCREGYSNGQILQHNIPLFSMYALGTILIGMYDLLFGLLFIIYIVFSNIVFMKYICAYCPHYGQRSSLCGYGLMTKYVAQRKRPREFKSQFKKYIAVLFPDWFVPIIFGILQLIIVFDWFVLILIIIFMVIAFGVVLYVSRSKSCKTCKLKDQCPWNSICNR